MEHMKKFADNLRSLMESRSITDVAKEIGIPAPTLSRYLLCRRQISLDNLIKIANYFDEDLDYLVGRKD